LDGTFLQQGRHTRQDLVERLLVGLLANGHVLLEGVPGLAKTMCVRTLAAAVRGGASNLSLCDTNGGTLVDEFKAMKKADSRIQLTAAALRLPKIAALVDAAKAYAFENDCYDEENETAMNAWRSARSKMNEALSALEPKP
jgi:hypothetical protein